MTDGVAVPQPIGHLRATGGAGTGASTGVIDGAESNAEAEEELRVLAALGLDANTDTDAYGGAFCVHAGMWRAARLLRSIRPRLLWRKRPKLGQGKGRDGNEAALRARS